MKKKIFGLLLAAPLCMGMGLTSCSSDEPLSAGQTVLNEKLVDVTIDAVLPAGTRTTLTPEGEILKFKWEKNDVIKAVNVENGTYLGMLTVSEVKADPTKCAFAGQLTVPADAPITINFYYLGKHEMKTAFDADTKLVKADDIKLNFSSQNGSYNDFADDDILIATESYQKVEGGNLGVLNFDRHFAYGRFILKYNGEELDLNGKTVTISAAEGDLYTTATLNPQTAKYTFVKGDEITVTPETNDFYVSLFPAEVQLQFTVRMGENEEFNGVKGGKFVAATYYTANTDGDPIVVEMKHEDGRDDEQTFTLTYHPNYEPTDDLSKVYTKARVGSADFKVQTYDLFTREGWELAGWNTEADGTGTAYAAGETLTITYPETSATLYAQWKEKEYTWTANWTNGYDGTILKTETVTGKAPYTTTLNFPAAPARDGYIFTGWEYNGNDVTAATKFTFTKEMDKIEIKAKWEEKAKPTVTTPGYEAGSF